MFIVFIVFLVFIVFNTSSDEILEALIGEEDGVTTKALFGGVVSDDEKDDGSERGFEGGAKIESAEGLALWRVIVLLPEQEGRADHRAQRLVAPRVRVELLRRKPARSAAPCQRGSTGGEQRGPHAARGGQGACAAHSVGDWMLTSSHFPCFRPASRS